MTWHLYCTFRWAYSVSNDGHLQRKQKDKKEIFIIGLETIFELNQLGKYCSKINFKKKKL